MGFGVDAVEHYYECQIKIVPLTTRGWGGITAISEVHEYAAFLLAKLRCSKPRPEPLLGASAEELSESGRRGSYTCLYEDEGYLACLSGNCESICQISFDHFFLSTLVCLEELAHLKPVVRDILIKQSGLNISVKL